MNAVILVIDDHVVLAEGMVHILNKAGYETHSAHAGADGLLLAQTLRPEIVILDVNLPDRDGKAICRQIKAQEPRLAPYVLLISGVNMTSQEQAEGLEAGADEYAVKPISDRELLARVRLLLRVKRSEEALRNREQTMRTLLDAYSDAVLLTDMQGRIVEANASLLQYAHKDHAHLIGQSVHELFPPPLAAQYLHRAQMVLKNGQPVTHEVLVEDLWYENHWVPLRDVHGAIIQIALYTRNITARKRMETALHELNATLEERVKERTAELEAEIAERQKAEQQLQQSLAEIRRLKNQALAENIYLREEIQRDHHFDEIIGQSGALNYLLFRVEQVAPTDTTVLITGETGTGKELIARAIHQASSRKEHPLVKVNCATLPSHLIESELFGHEAGAFTGATTKRIGRFELADQGTLFLDEIGELPLDLQAKLLRVLQEGEFERVGSSTTRRVNVRLIASTNRDLDDEIRAGRFRQDLYYRLNVYPLSVPPLRARPDDIPPLVYAFVQRFNKKIGRTITQIPQPTLKALSHYAWPGNVRELQNLIERSVITTPGHALHVDLPEQLAMPTDTQKTLEDVEYDYIVQVLTQKNWRISGPKGAALVLGLHPETLRSRMRKLGIRKPDDTSR